MQATDRLVLLASKISTAIGAIPISTARVLMDFYKIKYTINYTANKCPKIEQKRKNDRNAD